MQFCRDSDYCPSCGHLLDFAGDTARCRQCLFDEPFGPRFEAERVSAVVFERPEWLARLEGGQPPLARKERVIEQECPSCGHGRMFVWQLQVRSADEGSTVFYRCVKCEHTFNQNN